MRSRGRCYVITGMKRLVRASAEAIAPTFSAHFRAARHRSYFRSTFSELQRTVATLLFQDEAKIAIQTGPFQGLLYLDEIVWGSITPKWLGSYEAELHSVIDGIIRRRYATVVNVGCAEGCYAVGFASVLPRANVVAFDIDFISRAQLSRLAELNGVISRIQIRTSCSHAALDDLSTPETLVICDIEGLEAELLNPEKAARLRHADVLVEVHETCDNSHAVEELLRKRFATSHEIQRIEATDRSDWIAAHATQLPSAIPIDQLRQATDEHRITGRLWLWMEKKGHNRNVPPFHESLFEAR